MWRLGKVCGSLWSISHTYWCARELRTASLEYAWPIRRPKQSAASAVDAVGELLAEAAGLESPADVPPASSPAPSGSDRHPALANGLPTHAHGLLKIGVPVAVTLAAQRKSVQEIIELGPGSIIKFDKTCDEPLELCVGDQPIATGEVVKVGDKFGLRVGTASEVGGVSVALRLSLRRSRRFRVATRSA